MKENLFDIPLPHDELAERAVLGALLVHSEVVDYVINILKPEDFFNEVNRIIYETIIEIVEKGEKPHFLLVKNHLESNGKLEEIGGLPYIYTLVNEAATPSIIEAAVKQIKDKAIARGLIEISKKIILKAKNYKDINQLIEEAEAEIFRLNENRTISEYYPISEVIANTLKIINDLSKKDTIITGIPSGYHELDRLTTGFHEGDLIIIAARPAMGKTSFALSIIHNTSVVEKYPSAFFSLEMSKEQIAMRLLSLESRIPLKKLRSGFLSEDELIKLTKVASDISASPIYIDDTASLSILELKAKARRLKREKDIKLIIIDYLQLMRSSRRVESRQQEVAEISRGLKALAKELNIPVIALAQLSRQVEMRADKKPQLADLRESGCLTGDTLVINAETGKLVPIKSMVGKQFYTLSMDKNLKIRKAFVSKVFYSGRKKVYLLKTRTGREIKASANHPFFKIDENYVLKQHYNDKDLKHNFGWYRLDQLKVGDRIAVPKEIKANSDLLWDEIVSIEELGVEDVYDMTVEDTHNFIANDIIVHNSIEQDADLVMFIHRPEYYKKNPTPEEEGIAEIIIAKQRNGPTDIIKLAFIKEITKFENLAKGKEEEILEDDDIIKEENKLVNNSLIKDEEEEIILDESLFEDDEIPEI